MEIKKGYKMTDVGVIPEDWEVKSIGEVLSICNGMDYKHLNRGNYPVYGTGGLIARVDDFLFEGESVCIGRKGTIDTPIYLNEKFWTVDTLFYSINFVGVIPKFIYYIFNTIDWLSLNEASGVPSLSKDNIKLQLIQIPNLSEQQAIADALTKVDNLITLLTKVIEKKKLIKKGTMQKLLSGEVRLDGFEGEWKQIELCKESSFERGWGLSKEKISDNGSYNCILYGEIFTKYNYVAKTGFSKTNIKEGTPSLYGDIVLPGSTTTCGIDLVKAVAILKNNILLGGDVNIIRFDLKQYDPIFMAYYLSEINKDRIEELTKGITIIHLHISDLKNVIIDIPPTKAEQTAIAKVLTTMDDEIEALEKERDKYKCIKQGMMQQLLTGKIRLTCQ